MEFLYSEDPIIACSTNNEKNCAIAVIRLSGFENLSEIQPFISIDVSEIKIRYAHFCKIEFDDLIYDEVILTFFKGPNSYNGENIIELAVHGNTLNVDRIIKLFTDNSCFRHAYPGEFSYRALKNNKLSLSQVEGLDLLLNANSSFILQQGFSLLNGKLQKSYLDLHNAFIAHKSAVELSIDFLDDVGEENADKQFRDTLDNLLLITKKLKSHSENSGQNLINPEITLVGLPNAGKSSLFNILLQDNRAIVSNIAGTTRDYITENIKVGEIYCRLVDTAGIRKTSDEIESKGIQKSLDLITDSFFKILLINPLQFDINFFEELKEIPFDLIIFSHADVLNFNEASCDAISQLKNLNFKISGPIEPIEVGPMGADKSGPIEPQNSGPIGADLSKYSDKLLNLISLMVNKKYLDSVKNEPITIERHQAVINKLYLTMSNYNDLSLNERDISIISSELNGVGHCISELIGIVSPDDVLHNIFNNFCIGK